MKDRELDDEAKLVLLALFKDGAVPAKSHSTTVDKIVMLLDWEVGKESFDRLNGAITELIANNYSYQDEEWSCQASYISGCHIQGNNLTLTVQFPKDLIHTL